MARTRNNNKNKNNDSDSLTPAQRDYYVSKSIDRLQYIIKKSIEKYQKTSDSNALKLALDCHISLGETLREVEMLYSNSTSNSYKHDFELTK